MAKLAPGWKDIKALISKAEGGDVMAALDLAKAYRCDTCTELLAVICPLNPVSTSMLDVAADAIAIKRWQEQPANQREGVIQ